MSADSTRFREGRSSRGSTEHVVLLSFRGLDTQKGIDDHLHTRLVDAGFTVEKGKSSGHMVMSIFDGVEYSDAPHLTRSFGEAFHSHKMCFKRRYVEAGQRALRYLSFLEGWESGDEISSPSKLVDFLSTRSCSHRDRGAFVRIVVGMVLSELRQGFRVDVPEILVGIDDHVKKIFGLLDITSNYIRAVGVYGMGGIGKITFTFS